MSTFGHTVEAAGGIDAIDPHQLAEMIAFVITRDQIRRREQDELAASMMASKPI